MTGIKALARHLDLSIGTVSRALNGRPDVNDATRKRVLEAARDLGYRANQSGRALRNGRTNTIGLVLETGTATALGGDTFFMLLVDSMQEVLADAGIDLVLLPCRSADDPIAFLQRLIARQAVDALVITATQRQDPRIAFLVESGTPFLTLGRSKTPGTYPWIDLDFAGVARTAVQALAALGHERIAIAAHRRDINLAHVFIGGYRAALADLGLPQRPDYIIRASASENGGVVAAETLLALSPRPTAVLLAQELMAIGVYSRLQQAGLRPGVDLSVVGFRKTPQLRFLQPGLACFELDLAALGRAVGQSALDLVTGADKPQTHLVWPLVWQPADSIQPPPGAV